MIAIERMKCIVLFLVLSLAINTIAGENKIVFKGENFSDCIGGKVPPGIKVIKEGAVSVLCLKSKNKINLVLKEIPVKPHIRYKLSFQAKINNANRKLKFNQKDNKLPFWEIRILDSKGRLPYEGYLKHKWQHCFSVAWRKYQQTFYTPETGRKLQIVFSNGSGKNTLLVKNIKLERIISENILINSDFAGGQFDYSGWNDLNRAHLVEEKGKTSLKVNPGGYAVTDHVPITPGKYVFTGLPCIPEMFFYDSDMMRIDFKRIRTKTFATPDNAKYMQFFFGYDITKKFSLKKLKTERK